ncbi:unnamed protein product [Symbiodinium natans]|uniref:Uncharacterized protein n=1 Tax=Symbiodinium natans TaxID=878477 RepID=A0A812L928_9DINO|nr:unnamed protein product [Symbiodinium natans]
MANAALISYCALLLSDRLEHEITLAPLAVKALRSLALLLLQEPSLVSEDAVKEAEMEPEEEQARGESPSPENPRSEGRPSSF